MSDYGVVLDPTSIRFIRILPASVEEVWAFLTESEKRGRWLASGDMELREGGGVTLRFVHADLSSVAEPVPEAPSSLLSELAQQPNAFTPPPPAAPAEAATVRTAEAPTPAAPTWQGMALPGSTQSPTGAAPSPSLLNEPAQSSGRSRAT